MNNKEFERFCMEYPEVGLQDVREEYARNEQDMIKRGMSPISVTTVAWMVTKRTMLRKAGVIETPQYGQSSGDVTELEGVIMGAGELRDKADEMRKKAKKVLESRDGGKGSAMSMNLVDVNGRVLDTREKLFGKPNEGCGKPLDPDMKLYEMNLVGAFREKGTDNPFAYTRFQTSNNNLAEAWAKIELPKHAFSPCTTFGKIKVDKYGFMVYGLTGRDQPTVFKPCDATFNPQIAVEQALGQYMSPIGDAYEAYKTWLPELSPAKPDMTQKYVDWNAMVACKGLITDIQFERDFWKGIPAKMWDLEDVACSIDVYLPPSYKNPGFGEYTIGVIYGKPDEVWTKGANGNYDVRSGRAEIRAMGFYPMPDMITQGSTSQTMLEDNQTQYVGFEESG